MKISMPLIIVHRTKVLEIVYIVIFSLLLSAVVFTPFLIRRNFLLTQKFIVEEDVLEALLIVILLSVACLLSYIYKAELKKYRLEMQRLAQNNSDLSNKLTDAFKYIGGVNVQIQEIRSVFCGLGSYPTTENEFRKDLAFFARKVLGIVNADWVMIRIIRQTNLRTIKEHLEPRKNMIFFIKGISNKAIVADRAIDGYSLVASRRDNSMIMVVCIFPKKNLDEEEKILIEAITNQIEMLYLIFVSRQLYEICVNRKPITRMQKKLTTLK